jgi:outer membrane protein, heavy metal efflux system
MSAPRSITIALLLLLVLLVAGSATAQHEHHHPEPAPEPAPAQSGHHHHEPAPAQPEAAPYALPSPTADPGLPVYTLDGLERRALENHPALAQAAEAVRAAEARSLQAGLWPNPVVGYTAEDVPTNDLDGGRHGLFVAQEIPLGGKQGRSREVFARDVERVRATAEAWRLERIAEVRAAFHRTLAAQHRVRVREQLSELARETVDVTGQLFNTGLADNPDRLAAETEASLAESDLSSARIELDQRWATLRAVVGDSGLEPGVLQGDLAALPDLDRQELWQRVLAGSPQVLIARAQAGRAEAALARAKAERAPDLEIEAGVRKGRGGLEAGDKEAFADIGIRLPLFNRNQGGIAAAEADLAAARLEEERTRLALEARFAEAWSGYRGAAQRAKSYHDGILDRARTAHRQYLEQYRQMMVSYPEVLNAQHTLFRLEEDYIGTLERAWQAAVSVETLLPSGAGPMEAGAQEVRH